MIYLGDKKVSVTGIFGDLLPKQIDKMSSGTYTPTEHTNVPPVIQHNLGVVPDLFVIYTNDEDKKPTSASSYAFEVLIEDLSSSPTTSTFYDNLQLIGAYSYTRDGVTEINMSQTDAYKAVKTEATITLARRALSYQFIGGAEYKWVAIKFKEVNNE